MLTWQLLERLGHSSGILNQVIRYASISQYIRYAYLAAVGKVWTLNRYINQVIRHTIMSQNIRYAYLAAVGKVKRLRHSTGILTRS